MRLRQVFSTCLVLLTLLAGTVGGSPLPGGGSLILRLRLPNGETKRVSASPTDTVADVRARAAAAKSAPTGEAPLYLDAACSELAEDGKDLVSLGLENGALLFCGGDRASMARGPKEGEPTTKTAATTTPSTVDKPASAVTALEERIPSESKATCTSPSTRDDVAPSAKKPLENRSKASVSEANTAAGKILAGKKAATANTNMEKTTPPKKAANSVTSKKPSSTAFSKSRGRKLGKGVTRSFEDLSSERSAVKVVRQKAPKCTQLSLDAAASQQLAAYLATKPLAKTTGSAGSTKSISSRSRSSNSASGEVRPRRVALLYGTSRPDTSPKAAPGAQVVTVDAIWEPPQPNASPQQFDARSLCKAVELGSGGKGSSSSGGCPASKVAHGLGLRVVGWLFSHPPRGHFLAPSEVRLTAQLRACVEKQHGKAAGASFVVVAVRDGTAPPDPKSPPKLSTAAAKSSAVKGSSKSGPSSKNKGALSKGADAADADQGVSFEAYQLSNQCYAWLKDGTIAAAAADGEESGDKGSEDETLAMRTSKAVWAEGQETRAVDTAHFAVPVPIVAHRGFLATRFPPANRPELRPSPSIVRRAIFGEPPRGGGGSGAKASKRGAAPDSGAILKRLADFHLLLYLHKKLPADLSPLLELVQRSAAEKKPSQKKGGKMTSISSDGDGSLALPPYYLAILENLCEPKENDD